MTQAERIRYYLKERPQANSKEIAKELGLKLTTVKGTISKDLAAGRCYRTVDGGLNYDDFFKKSDETTALREWQNEVRRELIDQLLEANRHETASDQIRLNAKEINKLLKEVTTL